MKVVLSALLLTLLGTGSPPAQTLDRGQIEGTRTRPNGRRAALAWPNCDFDWISDSW